MLTVNHTALCTILSRISLKQVEDIVCTCKELIWTRWPLSRGNDFD